MSKKSKQQNKRKSKTQSFGKTTTIPKQPVIKSQSIFIAKQIWALIVGVSVMLSILGFFLYFTPRVSFSPGQTLDAQNAFDTPFIFKNEGNASVFAVKGNMYLNKLIAPEVVNMYDMLTTPLNFGATRIEPNKEQTLYIANNVAVDFPIDVLEIYVHFEYEGWGIPWVSEDWFCYEAQRGANGYNWYQRETNDSIIDHFRNMKFPDLLQ